MQFEKSTPSNSKLNIKKRAAESQRTLKLGAHNSAKRPGHSTVIRAACHSSVPRPEWGQTLMHLCIAWPGSTENIKRAHAALHGAAQ